MPTKFGTAMRTLFVSAVYAAVYMLMQMVVSTAIGIIGAYRTGGNFLKAFSDSAIGNVFLSTVIAMFITLAIFIAFGALRERPLLGEIRIAPISSKLVIHAVILALELRIMVGVYTAFSENIDMLRESLESRTEELAAAFDTPLKLIIALIAAEILAPIFEELLFRGLIQTELMRGFRPGIAIFINALIFGAIHGVLFQSIFTFFVGLALGWCFYKTGSLLTSIVLHMAFNSSALLQYALGLFQWPLLVIVFLLSLAAAFYTLKSISKTAACQP